MRRKFVIFTVFLFALLACVTAAAAAKVNDVRWGYNRSNVLRFTLDMSDRVDYDVKLEDNVLRVKVKADLGGSVARKSSVRSALASTYYLDRDDSRTVLRVPLRKDITEQQIKSFRLKPDLKNGRPERIVVDIAPGDSDSSSSSTSASSASTSTPATATSVSYRTSGGIAGKVITIDPGHGGSDPGAIGPNGVKEKDITLQISQRLKALLEDAGATVYMTRETDIDVYGDDATDAQELQARVDVSTNHNSDAFLSVHINANTNRSVGGLTTYYYPKTDYDSKLATTIQNQFDKGFGLDSFGTRQANFYVIKRSYMPAILAEICFITNPREEKLLQSSWFQRKIAKAIADGVTAYFE